MKITENLSKKTEFELRKEESFLVTLMFAVIILGVLIPNEIDPELYNTLWPGIIVLLAELPILYRFHKIRIMRKKLNE